jgi:hypothetical protein
VSREVADNRRERKEWRNIRKDRKARRKKVGPSLAWEVLLCQRDPDLPRTGREVLPVVGCKLPKRYLRATPRCTHPRVCAPGGGLTRCQGPRSQPEQKIKLAYGLLHYLS